MRRAAACLSVPIAWALVACTEGPTTSLPGAATSACAPLGMGATVTAAGLTKDGHYVVVVSHAGAARAFYGVATHLVEGVITGMHESCAVEVDFDVAGRSEVATFSPGPPACDVASTLTSGNAGDAIVRVPLTVLSPADAGAFSSLAFYCL